MVKSRRVSAFLAISSWSSLWLGWSFGRGEILGEEDGFSFSSTSSTEFSDSFSPLSFSSLSFLVSLEQSFVSSFFTSPEFSFSFSTLWRLSIVFSSSLLSSNDNSVSVFSVIYFFKKRIYLFFKYFYPPAHRNFQVNSHQSGMNDQLCHNVPP